MKSISFAQLDAKKMTLKPFALLALIALPTLIDAHSFDSVPIREEDTQQLSSIGRFRTAICFPNNRRMCRTRISSCCKQGGSILLGPLFGGLNIGATSKKLANQTSGQFLSTDVSDIAIHSLLRLGVGTEPREGAYVLPSVRVYPAM